MKLALFVLAVVLSVLSLAALGFMLHEGFQPLWLCATIALVLTVVVVLNWRARPPVGKPDILPWIAIVVTVVPLAIYGVATLYGVFYHAAAAWFAARADIRDFQEEVIRLPGITGPVGVRLRFSVSGPFTISALMISPMITTQSVSRRTGSALSSCASVRDGYCMAVPPLTIRSVEHVKLGDRRQFEFNLYPSRIAYLERPATVCLVPDRTTSGGNVAEGITIHWRLPTQGGAPIDLGSLRGGVLERESRLLSAETLKSMYINVGADTLTQAGYKPCERQNASSYRCFCHSVHLSVGSILRQAAASKPPGSRIRHDHGGAEKAT